MGEGEEGWGMGKRDGGWGRGWGRDVTGKRGYIMVVKEDKGTRGRLDGGEGGVLMGKKRQSIKVNLEGSTLGGPDAAVVMRW